MILGQGRGNKVLAGQTGLFCLLKLQSSRFHYGFTFVFLLIKPIEASEENDSNRIAGRVREGDSL